MSSICLFLFYICFIMIRSFYAYFFPVDETTDLKNMLRKFGLVFYQNIDNVAEVTLETEKNLSDLDAYSVEEINEALAELNKKIAEVDVSFNTEKISSAFSIDIDLIQQIESHTFSSCLEKNILNSFLYVYQEMNKNRINFNLIYHNPRHAAEMFFDAFQLCSKSKVPLNIH